MHGDLLGVPGDAEPAHAVGQARGREPDLGVVEALVDGAEHRVLRDEDVLELQLAVTAEEALVEGVDVPGDPQAGRVRVDEEHRGAAPVARAPRRARHADRERRAVGAGDEPLASVDQPARRVVGVAVVDSAAGSEPAPGAGSVIAKQDRTVPRASGRR